LLLTDWLGGLLFGLLLSLPDAIIDHNKLSIALYSTVDQRESNDWVSHIQFSNVDYLMIGCHLDDQYAVAEFHINR
jgi:hypothetical protein